MPMDDELRGRLDQINRILQEIAADVDRLRETQTVMQIADADARADAKVVAGKLDNAAVALANAAQSFQVTDLQRSTAAATKDAAVPSRFLTYVIVALLGIIAALVGVKTLDPGILKALVGAP